MFCNSVLLFKTQEWHCGIRSGSIYSRPRIIGDGSSAI